MRRYLLDANILIRLLTGEPENQYEVVRSFLVQAESDLHPLYINSLVVAEVVFVLTGKVYSLDRTLVAQELTRFFENPKITVVDEEDVKMALNYFSKSTLDFVDCYLLANAECKNLSLVTFDKGIHRFLSKPVTLLESN